jgi:Lon protease-like protein
MAVERIPLFPLGLVLLPGMVLPLHIFEERYKQMISECLATNRSFGIVWFDGQAIRTMGCTARIV